MIQADLAGKSFKPFEFSYRDKDVFLYALSVGCGADDLDYTYEGRGPKVLPSFAVVPPFEPLFSALLEMKIDLSRVVHGEQEITIHKDLPPKAKLSTKTQVSAVKDTGKHAVIEIETKSYNMADDSLLFSSLWSILVRGGGGFGGEKGAKKVLPSPPDGAAPDFRVEYQTRKDQALLYRLNGDRNPLHADPDFAKMAGFPAPILHGLCTYGFATRAVLQHLRNDQSFGGLWARFTAPVIPGDRLITEGWELPDGSIVLETRTGADLKVLVGQVTRR